MIKSFQDRVSAYMRHTGQEVAGTPILVGVSGGVDSVVLLDVLCELGYECEVIHVNFRLRGSESDADECYVRELCEQQGLKYHAHQDSAQSYAVRKNFSVQMAAREIRYTLFRNTASHRGISWVAVGHHGDDQSESLLINLNRGTGPEGIAGMRSKRSLDAQITLIRPLLAEDRASICEYAGLRELHWREDTSNQDETYLRSRVRSQVIPHLNSKSLARSSNLVRQWVDEVIIPMIDRHFSAASKGQSLKISYLRELPDVLAHRLVIEGVRKWIPNEFADEELAGRIISLMDLQTGKRVEIGGGIIWRDRNYLTFADHRMNQPVENLELLPGSSPLIVSGGQLRLYLTDTEPKDFFDSDEAWLDAEKLNFPLTVRNWLPGDQIQPLGMQGTKKVSDLLTDVAVPVSRRANVSVVCSGEIIAWIVGYRLSHKFRVTKSTNRYARLCFEPN